MKIASSIAFALFLSTAEAFGPAAKVQGNAFGVSSSNNGGMTMRLSISDKKRRERLNVALKTSGAKSKEDVQTILLTPEVSSLVEKSNWRLRSKMLRQIRIQASKFDIEIDPSFGVP